MRVASIKNRHLIILAALTVPVSSGVFAQAQTAHDNDIVIDGTRVAGPEVQGLISARDGNTIQVTAPDGTSTSVALNEATKVKATSGLFGSKAKVNTDSLINGIPVTIKTMQADGGLVASQVTFRNTDFKTANMIQSGTGQRFAGHDKRLSQHDTEIASNAAATEALRGRVGDIDNYNVKATTNVNFAVGKADLTPQAKADLCAAAATAESQSNALLLVVGYTDSTGSEDLNQTLSEKRAAKVVNYLQQACSWKPYRMLTPTGMAKADPLADNSTPEGKAQNRRVAVNVLVSKAVDVAVADTGR